MRLYTLRHGLAGDRTKWQGDDAERPLTAQGKKKMAREAKRFCVLGIAPDAILTSPFVRAYQTAEIIGDELDIRVEEDHRLAPGFSIDCLADILRERAGANGLLLVGHEPDLSQVVGNLIGGGRVVMKKGGVACIDLPNPASLQGELLWLLSPKTLVD